MFAQVVCTYVVTCRVGQGGEVGRVALIIVVVQRRNPAASFQAYRELCRVALEVFRGEGDPVRFDFKTTRKNAAEGRRGSKHRLPLVHKPSCANVEVDSKNRR